MKISFDRKEYLSVSSVFENDSLDDVNTELSEFNDDATDLAYELAYTRYALAKIEARHKALVEEVAWLCDIDDAWRVSCNRETDDAWVESQTSFGKARSEVGRLIAEGEG